MSRVLPLIVLLLAAGVAVASGVYHVIVRADGGSAHARLTLLK